MPQEPTYLGTVEDVRGASISVALAKETASGLTFISGVAYRIGQVGAFIRIPIGYVDMFGIVTQVGAGAVPERLAAVEPHGHRWMTVELIGEGERGSDFQRGGEIMRTWSARGSSDVGEGRSRGKKAERGEGFQLVGRAASDGIELCVI